MIVQFAGILIATFSTSPVQIYDIGQAQGQVAAINPVAQALYYIFSVAVFTILILAILRLYKNKGALLFRIIEAFAVGFGSAAMFFIILSTLFYYANTIYVVAASAVIGAVIVIAKTKNKRLRNFAALTSSIGLGVIIGAYGFSLAYLFMFIMAIYDYIAVFITKHMLVLAKAASNSNLSLLIGSSELEVIPKSEANKKDMDELKKEIKKNNVSDPFIKRIVDAGELPVVSQIQLGAGDLTLPLVLSVGIFISTFSYYLTVVAAVGAVAGLICTMWLLKRYKAALPAIPPLFALMNIFVGIGMLATAKPNYVISAAMVVVGILFFGLMIITLERKKKGIGRK